MSALTPQDTPANLQALHELPLPAPVSYLPQTIGWLFVGIVLLAFALLVAWFAWRRHERGRYRREALAELASIEAKLARQDMSALADIAPLVKRAAMAASTRDRVAALSGHAWLAYLKRMHASFDEESGALLFATSYAPRERLDSVTPQQADRLVRAARDWIAHHHVEV